MLMDIIFNRGGDPTKYSIKKLDFKVFGKAIKANRKQKGLTRKQLAEQTHLSARYIASIENRGQTPSLQVFYRIVTLLEISVDQIFFTEKALVKTSQRRQLDSILDRISENGLRIVFATAREIEELEQKR